MLITDLVTTLNSKPAKPKPKCPLATEDAECFDRIHKPRTNFSGADFLLSCIRFHWQGAKLLIDVEIIQQNARGLAQTQAH